MHELGKKRVSSPFHDVDEESLIEYAVHKKSTYDEQLSLDARKMPENAFVPNLNSGFRIFKKEIKENLGFTNMETMVLCFGDNLISVHRSQWG